MYAVIGIVILLVMVFGGFAITGGALGPVFEAIPHEMLIIGGAAVGALLIGLTDTFGKVFFPDYAGIAVYLLMAAILLWRPEGLFRRA